MVDQSVDEKSKVRRILYSFNIRKVFTYIRRFARPKEDPFAAMTDFFKSLSTKPKEEVLQFKGKVVKPRAPLFRTILIITILLLVLGVVFYIITNVKLIPETPIIPPSVAPITVLGVNVIDSGFLDSYDGQKWYSILTINGSNLDYANLSLSVFKDFAPEDVFILRSVKKDATTYEEFKKVLYADLGSKGMSVTEITVDDLLRMPNDLKITLIVPSGYLPTFFLGLEDPNFDIIKFTKRGNSVIYIGRSPVDFVIARTGELIITPPEKIEKEWGLNFQTENQPFDKFKPLYRIEQGSRQENIDIRSQIGSTSVTWGGGGYVYFLPTTLDAWWSRSSNQSAKDISDIVANVYWGYYYASGSGSATATDGILNTTSMALFTAKLEQRSSSEKPPSQAYGRLFINTEKVNDSAKSGKMIQIRFSSPPNGRIENYDSFIATSIAGKNLDLTYKLNEPTLREEQIYLNIINSSGIQVKTISLGVKSLILPKEDYSLSTNFPSGDYILRITDSIGSTLAQSYMRLAPFSIEPQSLGWDIKLFIFNVLPEGEIKNPYVGEMKPVKISLDGKDEKEVKLTNGRLVYESSFFPSPGMHTFRFVIGEDIIIKNIEFIREPSFIEKYWYMILITIFIFGIGFMIRRPEKAEYFLDVPDFPLHSIAIPLKREMILEMFNTVNKELKWNYVPLSIQDLKSAFRKVSFQGRPVIIGDYNLEHILDQLVEEGYLKHALDYYGLISWEKEAKNSIYLFAMQRALRDLFVVEGIPFIPFGQRTDTDTVVSVGGEKICIHIYENDSVVYRAVQTAPQGRTIIVFEDEQTMKDFTNRIHSSSETNVVFKMLLDDPNGNIYISPISKLINVLNKKYTFFYY